MAPRACGKFYLSSNFLKMSSHSTFVDRTFPKADDIRSTVALQQPLTIYDALRNLVLFVQLKKREKHPWRSVNKIY